MNDRFDRLDRIAARAREDRPPEVRVAGRVMAMIGERQAADEWVVRPLYWLAGMSSAAAALAAAVLAFPVYQDWSDPLLALLIDLPWGIL